jgi:hypothetical protein
VRWQHEQPPSPISPLVNRRGDAEAPRRSRQGRNRLVDPDHLCPAADCGVELLGDCTVTDTEQRAREALAVETEKDRTGFLAPRLTEAAALRALTTLLTRLDDVERERDEAREECTRLDNLATQWSLEVDAAEARCERLEEREQRAFKFAYFQGEGNPRFLGEWEKSWNKWVAITSQKDTEK